MKMSRFSDEVGGARERLYNKYIDYLYESIKKEDDDYNSKYFFKKRTPSKEWFMERCGEAYRVGFNEAVIWLVERDKTATTEEKIENKKLQKELSHKNNELEQIKSTIKIRDEK
jgi:hypothetical protein